MKKHKVKVTNWNWMGSLETAWLSITTPKGTNLTIEKWPKASYQYQWDKADKWTKELVWKIAKHDNRDMELTRDEIMILFKYSQWQNNLDKVTGKGYYSQYKRKKK